MVVLYLPHNKTGAAWRFVDDRGAVNPDRAGSSAPGRGDLPATEQGIVRATPRESQNSLQNSS